MKTVELQFRAHRYLVYIVVLLVPLVVLMMVNGFFDRLDMFYRGYRTGGSSVVFEEVLANLSIRDLDTLSRGLSEAVNGSILLERVAPGVAYLVYSDVFILLGFMWVLISYIFVYDPVFRGHYTMLMNLSGYSRGRLLLLHMAASILYALALITIIVAGIAVYHVRAGTPFLPILLYIYLAMSIGYIAYHLLGLFLGMVTRSVEISMLSILPFTLIKPLDPENPLSFLSPDTLLLYSLIEEYAELVSIDDVVLSLLFYLLLGLIGFYLFVRGRSL